ncbi:MAG: hypothetical protein ACXAC5_02045 [Promethearchaeota archaeon]|jgi:hypothetical protein
MGISQGQMIMIIEIPIIQLVFWGSLALSTIAFALVVVGNISFRSQETKIQPLREEQRKTVQYHRHHLEYIVQKMRNHHRLNEEECDKLQTGINVLLACVRDASLFPKHLAALRPIHTFQTHDYAEEERNNWLQGEAY